MNICCIETSPNCDVRPADEIVSLVVIHAISLPPDRFGGPGVRQLFLNCLDPSEDSFYAQIQHLRVSTVIPLFDPPDGLSPASVAMVMRGREDNDQITPAMISLAVKGHLRIDEKKENVLLGIINRQVYTIVKLKGGSGLPREEQEFWNRMFGSGRDRFEIDGSYDTSVQSMASAFRSTLRHQWHGFLNKGNNLRFWWIPLLTVFLCAILLLVLHHTLLGDNDGLYIGLFLAANVVLFLLYRYLIKRPSEEKQALRSRILGFKMYLSAAEEKQLQHFNPPTMTPEVFERFLPYAIAFKVEKVWGDRFQDMISRAVVDPNYRPGWYGGSISNFGSFSRHMNSSLSSSLQSSSTPPSKSGGSSGGGSVSTGPRARPASHQPIAVVTAAQSHTNTQIQNCNASYNSSIWPMSIR